jgi:hypothetical protein
MLYGIAKRASAAASPPPAVGYPSSSIEASWCTCSKVKIKSPTHFGDLNLRRLVERQMQSLAFLLKDSGCAAKECQNGNVPHHCMYKNQTIDKKTISAAH